MPVTEPSPDTEWRLHIIATSKGITDHYNWVGIEGDARTQWDCRDRSEPPPSFGRAIAVYFPHGQWETHPGNYTVDVRGGYQSLDATVSGIASLGENVWGQVWRFDVAKTFSDERAGDEVDPINYGPLDVIECAVCQGTGGDFIYCRACAGVQAGRLEVVSGSEWRRKGND